ncbi:leucine tRS [Acrasis kona]|uniref:Leucine tRS n=1 Tax=Acrasis kona TaxID=1008807 RepID=A0AAW2Z544_9EUKA
MSDESDSDIEISIPTDVGTSSEDKGRISFLVDAERPDSNNSLDATTQKILQCAFKQHVN